MLVGTTSLDGGEARAVQPAARSIGPQVVQPVVQRRSFDQLSTTKSLISVGGDIGATHHVGRGSIPRIEPSSPWRAVRSPSVKTSSSAPEPPVTRSARSLSPRCASSGASRIRMQRHLDAAPCRVTICRAQRVQSATLRYDFGPAPNRKRRSCQSSSIGMLS